MPPISDITGLPIYQFTVANGTYLNHYGYGRLAYDGAYQLDESDGVERGGLARLFSTSTSGYRLTRINASSGSDEIGGTPGDSGGASLIVDNTQAYIFGLISTQAGAPGLPTITGVMPLAGDLAWIDSSLAAVQVPEPGPVILLDGGGFVLMRRKRKKGRGKLENWGQSNPVRPAV